MPRATIPNDAVDLALAYYRAPLAYQRRLAVLVHLPAGMDRLLALANGSAGLLTDDARRAGAYPDELRKAARFLVQQLCFQRGASHYRVLGLEPDAPFERIKDHRRRLMWLYHPDRAAGTLSWTDSYAARINEAWAVLSRPASRARYDAELQRMASPPPLGRASGPSRGAPQASMGRSVRQIANRPPSRRSVGRRASPLPVLVGLASLVALLGWAIRLIVQPSAGQVFGPTVDVIVAPEPNNSIARAQSVHAADPIDRNDQRRAAEQRRPETAPPEAPPEPPQQTQADQTRQTPTPLVKGAPLAGARPVLDAASAPDSRPLETAPTAGEVSDLLERYADAYRKGDLDGLMALFTPSARGDGRLDRDAIRRDYVDLFGAFTIRRLELHDLRWGVNGETASAVVGYELWLQGRRTGQLSQSTGTIRLDLRKRDGQILIDAMDRYSVAF